jgi:ATP-dependent phosphofructokinase / diphosphate-dependent phosphofructokinase
VAVVMGRHAGFLTAASALGKKFPDDGPHLIYLPERTFVLDTFLSDVKTTFERYGRCVVAVSEGIHDASGTPIASLLAKNLEHDAHGNVQLSGNGALADLLCEEIKTRLKIKRVRGDTLGYLQRSFMGCVSDVDQREAREVGEKAVQFALWGKQSGSVAIKRTVSGWPIHLDGVLPMIALSQCVNGFQRCGNSSSIMLLRWVGNLVSTSFR